ncbi:serine acetyltransferase [Pseudoduganella chitinolytica]|uniref:Serine acetyltransferase n=1 Tax=Pseudoduganella chitinolytica TaxID=34070 RepID=A0ABY8B8D7_9BURK|nr:serine acetyltransferase [Pseudoduganella chitinolytica]WEF31308.1 serine acetyltransferase [Pseudoduganella chitinolytica]
MLARLLVAPFGSAWKLKERCVTTRRPFVKKVLVNLYGLYQYENNSSIAWNAQFAGEPFFPHGPKSIFISGGAKIGKNCVIFQQVTIGSNTLADSKGAGAPVIGDNCYIGAGAKIVGNVRVGDNVRVGANALVYKDVPANSVVVSSPSEIIQRETPQDNRFYSFQGRWVYWEDARWNPVTDDGVLARLNKQF